MSFSNSRSLSVAAGISLALAGASFDIHAGEALYHLTPLTIPGATLRIRARHQ